MTTTAPIMPFRLVASQLFWLFLKRTKFDIYVYLLLLFIFFYRHTLDTRLKCGRSRVRAPIGANQEL